MPTPITPRPSRRTPTRPAPRQRLALHRLEDRRTPALIAWDGGPGGNGTDWLDPANWAGDVLPDAADDVTLGATGTSPTIVVAANAAGRSVSSSRAVQITGGALALGAMTSTFSNLTLNGGTLDPTDGTSLSSTTINGPTALAVGPGETVAVVGTTTVNSPLANAGTLVARANLTVTGAYTSVGGSTLRVQGNSAVGLSPAVSVPGFTNNGLVELSSLNSVFSATLTVAGGVLTNAAGGTVRALVNTGGTRTLALAGGARLDNQGTLTVTADLAVTQAGAGAQFATSGAVTIATGKTLSPGSAFAYQGGTIGGGGTLNLTNVTAGLAAGLTVDAGLAFTLNGTTVNGLGTLTVVQGTTLTVTGSTTVNAPLTNNGTLLARAHLTVTGAFTTGTESTLRIQGNNAVGVGPSVTVPGFTNNGLVELSSIDALYSNSFNVLGGALINAAGGTISTLAGTGGSRSIQMSGGSWLDNRGTITVAGDTDIRPGAPTATNSGALNVVSGGDLTIIVSVFTNTGTFSVATGRFLNFLIGTLGNFSGNTLTGGTYVIAGTFNFPSGGVGTLHVLDCNLTLVGNQANVSGLENDRLTTIGPAGRFALAGNRFFTASGAFINFGTLLVNTGSRFTALSGLTNAPAGTLAGGGTVVSTIGSFGTVSPGTSPGVLTFTGNAILGGPFAAELDSTAPGTGYDQLVVNGAVNLSGATLAATFNSASIPAGGFVVIANDGTDAVAGTFAGLPEGATTSVGGRLLRVSYVGGTGNDIVLTTPNPYPSVAGVQVNAGQADLGQRSRVTAMAVTFDQAVTFADPGDVAAAFRLSRVGGGAVGGFTAAVNVIDGVTVVTLSGFSGAETRFGSLADGFFRLTVVADQVLVGGLRLDGDGDGTPGGDYVLNGTTANGLFSLYGDVNGDGVINAFDFGQFRAALGSSLGDAAYRDFLDFDGDGIINAFDFAQFRNRFGSSVP